MPKKPVQIKKKQKSKNLTVIMPKEAGLEEPVTLENVSQNIKFVKNIYDSAQEALTKQNKVENEKYIKCVEYGRKIITFLDGLNPFQINRMKEDIKTMYYISAEVLARTVGLHMDRNGFTDNDKGILYTSIAHLQKVLSVDPFNLQAKELYKIVFIYLTIFNPNAKENIQLLNNVLLMHPCDFQLQYNLAFMFQRVNDLESSLKHFKMAVGIIDLEIKALKPTQKDALKTLNEFKVKCLNGLGGIYFSIQDRELANYYFYEALKILPDDPDINNQIGVVFTELRYTDKAIKHYKHGIDNYKKAHISTDLDMLLASMHMNMGLAYCYEINYPKAIECYNTALKYKPRLSLAYQNKLLDLNYISYMIDDPMYIANLHRNLNKIYEHVEMNYKKSLPNYKINDAIMQWNGVNKRELIGKTKLRIGFISGDFICHPVSYFIHSILKFINYDIFDVYCYSIKVVDLSGTFNKIKWKVMKNTGPKELKTIIENDKIDILFDLASQTGDNRLDTFVLKPAPIQISYCGYPNTSGLLNMDYHIIDKYCDSDGVTPGPGGLIRPSTQKYYTEKLIFMDNCFLNYSPSIGLDNLPELVKVQPATENKYLTIGTFNRYNKINDRVVAMWEKILTKCPNVRFVIKTKEFLTDSLKEQFINTWKDKEVYKRVTILHYADTYTDHLPDYNKMDIALDTYPYSGTTTSCEALLMGVPVLTLFDGVRQYHSQNVTASLMINSDLPEYVCLSEEEYINKVEYYANNLEQLVNLKQTVRDKFIKGICDYPKFVSEFEDKLLFTYKNHKW
jgi:predicted O-linked N-acetylglucosamine transferase (SPINDLY family)